MFQKNLGVNVTIQKAQTEQLYSLLRDTREYSLAAQGLDRPRTIRTNFIRSIRPKPLKVRLEKRRTYDKLVEQSRTEKIAGQTYGLLQANGSSFSWIEEVCDDSAFLPSRRDFGRLRNQRASTPKKPEPCLVRDLDLQIQSADQGDDFDLDKHVLRKARNFDRRARRRIAP